MDKPYTMDEVGNGQGRLECGISSERVEATVAALEAVTRERDEARAACAARTEALEQSNKALETWRAFPHQVAPHCDACADVSEAARDDSNIALAAVRAALSSPSPGRGYVSRESHRAALVSLAKVREALDFIVNDAEPGEDAQLTAEGYNKACEALALLDAEPEDARTEPTPERCPICVTGEPHVSGLACACGGTGLMRDAFQWLHEKVLRDPTLEQVVLDAERSLLWDAGDMGASFWNGALKRMREAVLSRLRGGAK